MHLLRKDFAACENATTAGGKAQGLKHFHLSLANPKQRRCRLQNTTRSKRLHGGSGKHMGSVGYVTCNPFGGALFLTSRKTGTGVLGQEETVDSPKNDSNVFPSCPCVKLVDPYPRTFDPCAFRELQALAIALDEAPFHLESRNRSSMFLVFPDLAEYSYGKIKRKRKRCG